MGSGCSALYAQGFTSQSVSFLTVDSLRMSRPCARRTPDGRVSKVSRGHMSAAETSRPPGAPLGSSVSGFGVSWFPTSIRRTVRAGQNNRVTVRIAYPAFPMVRAAVTVRRVSVAGHDGFNLHRPGAVHRGIEIVNLEPEQHSVSVRLGFRIAYRAMMVLHIPSVELKDQLAADNEAFVIPPSVGTLTTEQSLIPLAARLNVVHANEGLWIHEPDFCCRPPTFFVFGFILVTLYGLPILS